MDNFLKPRVLQMNVQSVTRAESRSALRTTSHLTISMRGQHATGKISK